MTRQETDRDYRLEGRLVETRGETGRDWGRLVETRGETGRDWGRLVETRGDW